MGVFVIKDGEPVELDDRLWSFDPTMTPWSPDAFIGADAANPVKMWRTQPSVRTVVGFIARNIAQVRLHGFELGDNGDRERLPRDDEVQRTLDAPSPTTTGYDLIHQLSIDVCLYERWAARVVDRGDNVELHRIPPRRWAFRRDVFDQPTAIVVGEDRDVREFPLDRFVWLDGYPMPDDIDMSPLQSLSQILHQEQQASRYRSGLWTHGGRFPGWISRPADAPPWATPTTPEGLSARDRFKEGWRRFAAGGGREGETPLLEDGMQYHPVEGITPENGQQLESRKFSIAEVSAAFYLPPVFAGLLDDANYSNVGAFRKVLYDDTLGPWFQRIQQAWIARLLTQPAFGDTSSKFVEFNVAEKLRMSFEEQMRNLRTATGAPIMTRNEARKIVNLSWIEGADDLIVPLNVGFGDDGTDPNPGGSGTAPVQDGTLTE